MILVNINRSGTKAVTDAQIKDVARGAWVVGQASLEQYASPGDYLLAVRKNAVVGAWKIVDSWRDDADDRVTFELKRSREVAHLVGQDSPYAWTQGAANPVRLIDVSDVLGAPADVETTTTGATRAVVAGWTLTVAEAGLVAHIGAPDGTTQLSLDALQSAGAAPSATLRATGSGA
ncbi:hypothetical protein [Cellulomonas sp.]|uniref:hypothetical protein n=1 Tax=Cellulomonas sp. TaxID=40001 RepID=UPI003BABF0D8